MCTFLQPFLMLVECTRTLYLRTSTCMCVVYECVCTPVALVYIHHSCDTYICVCSVCTRDTVPVLKLLSVVVVVQVPSYRKVQRIRIHVLRRAHQWSVSVQGTASIYVSVCHDCRCVHTFTLPSVCVCTPSALAHATRLQSVILIAPPN